MKSEIASQSTQRYLFGLNAQLSALRSPLSIAFSKYVARQGVHCSEAALANEAARQLELALRKAADGREPVTAIREMSPAYIKFARDNRHLYEVMMSLHSAERDATSHQSLWAFTVEQVQRIAGSDRAAQASVALGRSYMEPWG